MRSKIVVNEGDKFHRWTVRKLLPSEVATERSKRKNRRAECVCDCGTVKIVPVLNLRYGSRSCGCLRREVIRNLGKREAEWRSLPNHEAAIRYIFSTYKYRAKKKGIEFSLEFDYFKKLAESRCYYCGIGPSNRTKNGFYGEAVFNGIDRRDSGQGYSILNSVSACKTCNFAKSAMSEVEFESWIRSVYRSVELRKISNE